MNSQSPKLKSLYNDEVQNSSCIKPRDDYAHNKALHRENVHEKCIHDDARSRALAPVSLRVIILSKVSQLICYN